MIPIESDDLRAVLDTNVLVSGLNFFGTPRRLLDLFAEKRFTLCLSPFILNELRIVLAGKFGWPRGRVEESFVELREFAVMVDPPIGVTAIHGKDADNRILECAVAANAHYIVSGDRRHIVPLEEFRGIPIVTPKAFLDIISHG